MPKTTHSPADLEKVDGWDLMSPEEQSALKAEDKGIQDDLARIGQSRLSLGKRLKVWKDILSPKGLFRPFLKLRFHMSVQTAYNYINLYEAASKDAPKPVLDIAMARNYRVINQPDFFKKNPAPETEDESKIVAYLDRIEKMPVKKSKDVFPSQDELLRETLHKFKTSYKQVANRSKATWLENFVGMALTTAGITNRMSFSPIAVPEHLTVVRGRPKAA